MTFKKIFTCSECERERQQANHWFVYTLAARGLEFHSWEWAAKQDLLEDAQLGHLCGQECAHKLLGRFLAAGTEGPGKQPVAGSR